MKEPCFPIRRWEGYVQGAVARGLEAAGSNSNGSMAGFMGMGMASNISGGMMGAASNVNLQQMQMMNGSAGAGMTQGRCLRYLLLGRRHRKHRQAAPVHVDSRIRENSVPIVENRHRKPSECSCGQVNSGNFCSNCGKPRA